jgi:hypothetical protein
MRSNRAAIQSESGERSMPRYWILAMTEENYLIAKERGLIGISWAARRAIQQMNIGDIIVFYLSRKSVDSSPNDPTQKAQQFRGIAKITGEASHSIGFRGGVCPRSSKASRRKDLQIEEPVACRYTPAFHLGSSLGRPAVPPLAGPMSYVRCTVPMSRGKTDATGSSTAESHAHRAAGSGRRHRPRGPRVAARRELPADPRHYCPR